MNKFNEKDQGLNQLREAKSKAKQSKKGKVVDSNSSGADNEVSITVVSGKPPDFEYLLEI